MNSGLPEGWVYQKLENIVDKFQNGYAFSASGYVNQGIPIVSIANISLDGLFKFDEKKEKKWPLESFVELERYRVNFGDLIIAMTDVTPTMNMIGRAAFVNRKQSMLLNQRVGLLICKSNVSKRYLSYALNSEKWIKYCKGSAGLGAQANIGTQDIVNGKIPIPPLPEQEKIAAVLGSVDDVIEKTALQIKKLNDLKQSTMNELLTKGIGHTDFKPSELGQIPKSWEVAKLEDIASVSFSSVNKKSDFINEQSVKLCNYMDVYRNTLIVKSLDFMVSTASEREINNFTLDVGDVIITKDSETPDDIAIPAYVAEPIDNLVCGYHLAIIKPNQNLAIGKYLLFWFMGHFAKSYFYKVASGTTRFGIGIDAIANLKIVCPPIEEQEKIADTLLQIDCQIEKVENKLSSLNALKKSLMQDLLSGKVRVRV